VVIAWSLSINVVTGTHHDRHLDTRWRPSPMILQSSPGWLTQVNGFWLVNLGEEMLSLSVPHGIPESLMELLALTVVSSG
jgi:hypothetical protein